MITVVIAGIIALTFTLFFTPLFVRGFRRLQWGQFVREDGPKSHHAKRGTPTMGGIVFLLAVAVAYFGAKLIMQDEPSASALLILLLSAGCGLVGFIDDLAKTRKQQSLGLGGWAKIAGQVLIACVFGLLAINFPNDRGVTPASTAVSLFRDTNIDFMQLGAVAGLVLFLAWIVLIVTATSNAVNLTDGLDGLAGGASILVFCAYFVIAFWQFSQNCLDPANGPACYIARDSLDIAALAAAFAGALIGFVWWNTSPALLYMGDTGSMGIGGAVAAFAILTRTELLLILIGGLYLIEAGSVIVQRLYFKVTKGRRIFLMSPIHHHFELKGWAEVTVVVRFWIIAGVFVLVGIALFYSEWVLRNG